MIFNKKKKSLTASDMKALQIFQKVTAWLTGPSVKAFGFSYEQLGFRTDHPTKPVEVVLMDVPQNSTLHHVDLHTKKGKGRWLEITISGMLVDDEKKACKIEFRFFLHQVVYSYLQMRKVPTTWEMGSDFNPLRIGDGFARLNWEEGDGDECMCIRPENYLTSPRMGLPKTISIL